jgi:hypothetical protein
MVPLLKLLVNVVDAAFPVRGQLPETLKKLYCTARAALVQQQRTANTIKPGRRTLRAIVAVTIE